MNKFGLDIFDSKYTKKVYILGMSQKKEMETSGLGTINNSLYLKSHGKKYQINVTITFGHLIDEKCDIEFKEINNFSLIKNFITSYYACDGEVEGQILLNLISGTYEEIMYSNFSYEQQKILESLMSSTEKYNGILIISDVFGININDDGNTIFSYNKKYFTHCSANELMEILDINKKIKTNEDIER